MESSVIEAAADSSAIEAAADSSATEAVAAVHVEFDRTAFLPSGYQNDELDSDDSSDDDINWEEIGVDDKPSTQPESETGKSFVILTAMHQRGWFYLVHPSSTCITQKYDCMETSI